MLWIITGIIISYLVGSIPTAYIFGRMLKGIDIRKHGSGNVGATNAFRVLGKGVGIIVLTLDIAKGGLAIFLAQLLRTHTLLSAEIFGILLGISCIVGHTWTVFLQFKGGKGIATTLGVLIGLSFMTPYLGVVLLLTVLTWVLCFTLTRIVSFASVMSAIVLPVYSLLYRQSLVLIATCIFLSVFVLMRHKPNIIRLFQGKEARLKLH